MQVLQCKAIKDNNVILTLLLSASQKLQTCIIYWSFFYSTDNSNLNSRVSLCKICILKCLECRMWQSIFYIKMKEKVSSVSIPLSQSTHHISIKVSGTVRIPDQAILTWSDAGSGLAPQNPGRRPQAKAELVLESGHSDHRSKVQRCCVAAGRANRSHHKSLRQKWKLGKWQTCSSV